MREALLLAGTMLAAGAIATIVRQDANWDLKNYHFYNAWAFVHGRMGIDIAAAQLQTYLNPLSDLPYYAMVAADWPPRVIAFAMALPAGVGAYFLLRILLILFGDLAPRERRNYVVFAAVLGVTGANAVSLLGSTMNEWPGAALILAALWLLLQRLAPRSNAVAPLLGAGLLAGLASGLKLTAATFAVGLAVGLCARRPFLRRALPEAMGFGIAVLIGMAATSGFWMGELEARFASPVFPFFNQWFRSPWWDARPVLATTYGPQTALEWILFPLLLFGRTAGLVSVSGFRDWRLPILFVAALGALIAWVLRRWRASPATAPAPARTGEPDAWRFVVVFWIVSYVVWLAVHGLYRYVLPLELLSGALLLGCLRWILSVRWLNVGIVVVWIVVIASVRYPYVERIDYGRRAIEVTVPPIAADAAVLLLDDEPMAHVLPFFPPGARFVGVKNNLVDPAMTNRLASEIADVVRGHPGPLYALAFPAGSNEAVLAAHRLRRVPAGCASVVSNLSRRPLELCRLERFDPA
jgi:hypothetical protein